jgi:hypothetical protein
VRPLVKPVFLGHRPLHREASGRIMHACADRHVGVVLACTISTGVRIFDANEIGLTRSWGCGTVILAGCRIDRVRS